MAGCINESIALDDFARSVAFKGDTGEDVEEAAAVPGRKLYRLVAVSFGLLCVLQAGLNISLRLSFYSSEDSEAMLRNMTRERDELKGKLTTFEAKLNDTTRETDELKWNLTVFGSQQNSLTQERDEWKRKQNDLASQQNSLTRERDELRRKLDAFEAKLNDTTRETDELKWNLTVFGSQQNSLTQERDEWKRKQNDLAAQQNSLTRERDELRRKLDAFASQQNSLTRERGELRRKLNAFGHSSHQRWIYFSGSFYYISSIRKNWQESRKDCQQKAADLVIINSEEEQEFTRSYQKVVWIGLTDRDREGEWKWVDGTPLTAGFWYSGEPDSYYGDNEDCAEIYQYGYTNAWNDRLCENENFWVCEKKMAF